MSNLIVVDDHKIRKTAFSRVDRLLKKLLRMEANLAAFYGRDQRLFTEWFELTFRERRRQMDLLRGEYHDLADFHNWMHALAEMEDLSLPQAAHYLRQEADLYRSATPEQRSRIEELRILREEYIRAESERQQRRAQARRVREEQEDAEAEAAQPITPDAADIEELALLAELDDRELSDWCADPDVAFMLLGKTLRVATYMDEYGLFFRLWDLIHPKIQGQFAKQFQKSAGVSLFDVLKNMRAKVEPDQPRPEAPAAPDPLSDPETPSPSADETLKLLYRQLARKLHPDMHASESERNADWRKKMWLRVQAAYKDEDLHLLNKLWHLVLLRGQELNDLRLSDLATSHQWLADEIGQTEESLRQLRRLPAWGFSRRKDLTAVERKLDRQLAKDQERLETQVIDLRTQLAFLERMGREEANSRKGQRKKTRRGNREMSFAE